MFLLFSSPLKQQPTKIFGKKNNLLFYFILFDENCSFHAADSQQRESC